MLFHTPLGSELGDDQQPPAMMLVGRRRGICRERQAVALVGNLQRQRLGLEVEGHGVRAGGVHDGVGDELGDDQADLLAHGVGDLRQLIEHEPAGLADRAGRRRE